MATRSISSGNDKSPYLLFHDVDDDGGAVAPRSYNGFSHGDSNDARGRRLQDGPYVEWCASGALSPDYYPLLLEECAAPSAPATSVGTLDSFNNNAVVMKMQRIDQLWNMDAQGLIHSIFDYGRCMFVPSSGIVGDSGGNFVEAPVEIGPCDEPGALNKFYYDDSPSNAGGGRNGGGPDTLKLRGYDAFCVTFLGGEAATRGAPMVVIPCGTTPKFGWDFVPEDRIGRDMPTGSPTVYYPRLRYQGRDACNPQAPCRACTGDCDTDLDCADGLECFQRARDDSTQVPGCGVGGPGDIPGADYCHDPFVPATPTTPVPTRRPAREPPALPPLVWQGGEGCTVSDPCRACTGDCDEDDDCRGRLACFKRLVGETTQVPGCAVGGGGDVPGGDYCHDPFWNVPRPAASGPSASLPLSPSAYSPPSGGGGGSNGWPLGPSPAAATTTTGTPAKPQRPPRPGEALAMPPDRARKDPRESALPNSTPAGGLTDTASSGDPTSTPLTLPPAGSGTVPRPTPDAGVSPDSPEPGPGTPAPSSLLPLWTLMPTPEDAPPPGPEPGMPRPAPSPAPNPSESAPDGPETADGTAVPTSASSTARRTRTPTPTYATPAEPPPFPIPTATSSPIPIPTATSSPTPVEPRLSPIPTATSPPTAGASTTGPDAGHADATASPPVSPPDAAPAPGGHAPPTGSKSAKAMASSSGATAVSGPNASTDVSSHPDAASGLGTSHSPPTGSKSSKAGDNTAVQESSKGGKHQDATSDKWASVALAAGRTRARNHTTEQGLSRWERDRSGGEGAASEGEGEEETATPDATGRTRNHIANNHASNHASTRYERDHPMEDGEGEPAKRTRDGTTRWDREHLADKLTD